MTIKRVNSTGRRKIPRHLVEIRVFDNGPRKSEFSAKLALSEFGFPVDSAVFVEAYVLSTYQRFSFGTIGNYQPPDRSCLSEFESIEGIKFRVKVVAQTQGHKHILAEADQLSPVGEEGRPTSLLHVGPADLGSTVYRVDLSDEPFLLMNRDLGDWRGASRSPPFVALAYPSILRQVLTQLIIVERPENWDDLVEWRQRWIQFASTLVTLPDLPPSEHPEEASDWIEQVVDAFNRRHGALSHFQSSLTER